MSAFITLSTCRTPRSPRAATAHAQARPIRTARAPIATIFTTSSPLRTPPSASTSTWSPTASAMSGRARAVAALPPAPRGDVGRGPRGRRHGVELAPAVIRDDDAVDSRVRGAPSVLGIEHTLHDEAAWPVFAHPGDVVPGDARVELLVDPLPERVWRLRVRHRLLEVAEGRRPPADRHVPDPRGVRDEVEDAARLRPRAHVA